MKMCVTTGILPQNVPFGQRLSFLKRAGFEEADFDINASMMLADGWMEAFCRNLEEAKEAGIRIRYAHLPFDYPNQNTAYGWDEFYTASCRAIDMAVLAGADCAAIHPRTAMKRDYCAEKEHDEALSFLRPYCDYARHAGLSLALENMRGPGRSADRTILRYCTETTDLIRLADELGIGICWDTGHANISAQTQRESLLLVGKRLKMVHVNDNWAEDDIHLAPFLGNIAWPEVMGALKEIGYRGSMNLEVGCRRLPEGMRGAYAGYMAESARTLIGMMEA